MKKRMKKKRMLKQGGLGPSRPAQRQEKSNKFATNVCFNQFNVRLQEQIYVFLIDNYVKLRNDQVVKEAEMDTFEFGTFMLGLLLL